MPEPHEHAFRIGPFASRLYHLVPRGELFLKNRREQGMQGGQRSLIAAVRDWSN
jgi:hypothetical protein